MSIDIEQFSIEIIERSNPDGILLSYYAPAVPRQDEFFNIKGKRYKVVEVEYVPMPGQISVAIYVDCI